MKGYGVYVINSCQFSVDLFPALHSNSSNISCFSVTTYLVSPPGKMKIFSIFVTKRVPCKGYNTCFCDKY